MKTIAITTALIIGAGLASPAFAAESAKSSLDGFYVGATAGLARQKADLTRTPAGAKAITGSANKTGLEYDAVLGYGKVLGKGFYLGAEGSIGAGGAKMTQNLAGSKVTVDPGLRYGAAVRAGAAFQNGGLLYGKVGFERERVEATLPGAKKTTTERGVVFGAGYEQQINESLALRGEVTRVNFKDRALAFASGDKLKLESNETRVKLGAIIRF